MGVRLPVCRECQHSVAFGDRRQKPQLKAMCTLCGTEVSWFADTSVDEQLYCNCGDNASVAEINFALRVEAETWFANGFLHTLLPADLGSEKFKLDRRPSRWTIVD